MIASQWKPALLIASIVLSACSGPETTTAKSGMEKKEVEAPAVPVTGKTAFWAMYKPAYAWANDILPLTLEAKTLEGFKNEDGKAAMWESTFGSMSRKQYCRFTYSIASKAPDIRKGVTAATAVPWAGVTKDALAFQTSEFQVDSDDAYKTALAKAQDFLKKNPDIKLTTMSMGAASRFPGPVWYFLWGDSKKLGFFQLVSATTGKALK